MSSQPNQSLDRWYSLFAIFGSSLSCYRMSCELARLMDINTTRVNRLLMTMASIGLTMVMSTDALYPGQAFMLLAAQVRGSALFSMRCLSRRHVKRHRGGIRRAMGKLSGLSIYLSLYAGFAGSQALAGVSHVPCPAKSVPGWRYGGRKR